MVLQDLTMTSLTGEDVALSQFGNDFNLIVNVASR